MMPNQNNSQNQPNATSFTQHPHIADKHVPFVAPQTAQQNPSVANQPMIQQPGVSVQQQQLASPIQQTQPAPQTHQAQQVQTQQHNQSNLQTNTVSAATQTVNQPIPTQQTYLNPNNFDQVLNGRQQQPTTAQPAFPNEVNLDAPIAPIAPMKVDYPESVKNPPKTTSKDDTTVLIIYLIPILAVFALLFKTLNDPRMMWHIRQSIVGQAIWIGVFIFLTAIDIFLLSDYGAQLWNLVCYGLLIFAGIKAYNGEQYPIPVVYTLGKSFIEEK